MKALTKTLIVSACLAATLPVAAFQADVASFTVTGEGTNYVVRPDLPFAAGGASDYRSMVHRLSEYSTNTTIAFLVPPPLSMAAVLELRRQAEAEGFHDVRFYTTDDKDVYARVNIIDVRRGGLPQLVYDELWQESMQRRLVPPSTYGPWSSSEWTLVSQAAVVLALPFWAGGQDSVTYWVVLITELLAVLFGAVAVWRAFLRQKGWYWGVPVGLLFLGALCTLNLMCLVLRLTL